MSDNEFFGGRRRRRGNGGAEFAPAALFANSEQGLWYDPSDLTTEKTSWRRNLLTYSQDFENAAWTKSNASLLSNLALYSQDFDNAAWAKTNVTVTANTVVAPDGTTTADKIEATTAAATTVFQNTGTATAATVTYSFYGKQGSGATDANQFSVYNTTTTTNAARISVNWTTGVVTTVVGTPTTTSTDVGNGWWRVTMTVSSGITVGDGLRVYAGFIGATETAGEFSYLWGAQLVVGSTAQTYTRSLATAAPVMFSDPLGGTMADKLVENTAAASHTVFRSTTISAGADFTYTVYVKAAERGFCQVRYENSGSTKFWAANVNLSDGTFTTQAFGSPTGTSASVTAVGSGWYRVTLGVTADTTTFVTAVFTQAVQGTNSYTGDGVSGVLVYGAQLEQASTASAYQRITDFNSDFLAAFPTHALYQESTGFTPVTALGQSVGMVLDKRLGGAGNLGAELVSNGNFSSGSTGWITTSWVVSGGAAEIINASDSIAQNVSLVAGRTYRVTYTVTSFSGTGGVRPRFFGGTTVTGTTVSNAGTYSEYLVAVTGNTQVALASTTATCAVIIDNISVREVPGNHAIQATSASRPTLQARANLLTYSEQFDNAVWNTVGSTTITANTIVAPDGTTTADLITASAAGPASAGRTQTVTFTGDGEKMFSVYLRVGDGSVSTVAVFDSTAATMRHQVRVTWTAGVPSLTSLVGAGTLFPVQSVGDGWYRIAISATGVVAANSNSVRVYVNNVAAAVTGNSVYVWGAQAENATTASTYQRIVTATDYADVGLPRNLLFDGVDDSLATTGNVDFATWTGSEARRNLLTMPSMFDDAAWSKTNATVTANTTAAPDGTTTADKLIATAVLGQHRVDQTPVSSAGTQTLSCYAKASEYGFVWLRIALNGAVFSLSDGTTSSVSANTTATATSVGSGWWRCVLTTTIALANDVCRINVLSSSSQSDYTGDGTSGIFVWGAQLETGSTATTFQNVGTDKVSVFSGLTKASDATLGVVVEFSATVVSNNGTFYIVAPSTGGGANYQFASKGTTAASVTTAGAAPDTAVITGLGDIGAPSSTIRRNAVATSVTTTQGTGTYLSYPLYIGRRNNTNLPFNGRIFQLIVRGAATDSVTVTNAEQYVAQKTGVTI